MSTNEQATGCLEKILRGGPDIGETCRALFAVANQYNEACLNPGEEFTGELICPLRNCGVLRYVEFSSPTDDDPDAYYLSASNDLPYDCVQGTEHAPNERKWNWDGPFDQAPAEPDDTPHTPPAGPAPGGGLAA